MKTKLISLATLSILSLSIANFAQATEPTIFSKAKKDYATAEAQKSDDQSYYSCTGSVKNACSLTKNDPTNGWIEKALQTQQPVVEQCNFFKDSACNTTVPDLATLNLTVTAKPNDQSSTACPSAQGYPYLATTKVNFSGSSISQNLCYKVSSAGTVSYNPNS